MTLAFLASKLAAVVSFAMAEPGRLMGQAASYTDAEDGDVDGEYELDDEEYDQVAVEEQGPDADGNTTDAEGSDVDAEGEEVDDDEDEAEPVGAVKIALRRRASSEEEEEEEEGNDEDAAGEFYSDAKTSDSDDESSSAESGEENQWQGESDDGGEAEVATSNPNACM